MINTRDGRQRQTLHQLWAEHDIILAPAAYDAASARIIAESGAPLVYLSGLAKEASDLGLPDLGFTNATEIVRRAGAMVRVVDVPVVSDADTGFGGAPNVIRTVQDFEGAGVSAIHLEDQTFPKRCGILAGKTVVEPDEFAATIKTACDARASTDFTIIVRSDAKNTDGITGVIDRLKRYIDAGSDAVMLGDFYSQAEYEKIAASVSKPLIACAADPDHYAVQPDYSRSEWQAMGVRMVVYWHLPLFAAMHAVRTAVQHLNTHGSLTKPNLETDGYDAYGKVVDLDDWLKRTGQSD